MTGTEFDLIQTAYLIGIFLVAGLAAGFLAGLFGIGGGFVVVPALLLVFNFMGMESDLAAHVAIGTSLATIIFTSLRSVQAHHKKGAVDFDIIKQWIPGLVLGVLGGIILANFMDGRSMKWVFSIGVFLMGLHFIAPVLKKAAPVSEDMPSGAPLWGLSTFLGGFSALLGIGGGTIAVLVMTSCGRSIHRAVATAAGFGVVIAVPGAIGFAILGLGKSGLPMGSVGYVNMLAALAIVTTSVLTAPLGAKVAHKLNGPHLKRVFGLYLVITSLVVLLDTFSHRNDAQLPNTAVLEHIDDTTLSQTQKVKDNG